MAPCLAPEICTARIRMSRSSSSSVARCSICLSQPSLPRSRWRIRSRAFLAASRGPSWRATQPGLRNRTSLGFFGRGLLDPPEKLLAHRRDQPGIRVCCHQDDRAVPGAVRHAEAPAGQGFAQGKRGRRRLGLAPEDFRHPRSSVQGGFKPRGEPLQMRPQGIQGRRDILSPALCLHPALQEGQRLGIADPQGLGRLDQPVGAAVPIRGRPGPVPSAGRTSSGRPWPWSGPGG